MLLAKAKLGMISRRLLMAGRAALGSGVRGYSVLRNSAMAGTAVPIKATMATDGLSGTTQPMRATLGLRARSGTELIGSRLNTASHIGETI